MPTQLSALYSLAALSVPSDNECYPANFSGAIAKFIQYTQINLAADKINYFNYGSTTPSVDDQIYPWIKTDTGLNPVGLYTFSNSTGQWTLMPTVVKVGSTAQRPTLPQTGEKFFDTTIGAEIVWRADLSRWITSSGTKFDLKLVRGLTASGSDGLTLSEAETKNPGWYACTGQTAPNGVKTPNMSNQFILVGNTSSTEASGQYPFNTSGGTLENEVEITQTRNTAGGVAFDLSNDTDTDQVKHQWKINEDTLFKIPRNNDAQTYEGSFEIEPPPYFAVLAMMKCY